MGHDSADEHRAQLKWFGGLLLGLLGYVLARRLHWHGIHDRSLPIKTLMQRSMALGTLAGLLLIVGAQLFERIAGVGELLRSRPGVTTWIH